MKRAWFILPVALAFGVAVSLASDFWEKKKFPDWSESEAGRMLSDSPWARPVLISLGSMAGSTGGLQPAERGSGGKSCSACADRASPMVGRAQLPTLAGSISLIVRWRTALPVKQAVAKLRFGEETANSPTAREFLDRQETTYIVSLSGLPAIAVPDDLEQVKASASLNVKGRPPIPAEHVQGSGAGSLALVFPKGQGGNHVITLEDREVEFRVKLGAISVSRKFKPKEMVYRGKLEL